MIVIQLSQLKSHIYYPLFLWPCSIAMLFTMKSHIIHYKWLKSHEITINSGVSAKTSQDSPPSVSQELGVTHQESSFLHGAAQQSMQGIDAKPSARFSGDGDWILTMISSRCRWICPLFIWIYHDLSMISMTWDMWDMFETTDGCLDGFQQQIVTAILGDQQSHGDPTFFSGGPGRGELGPFWDLHKNCGFRKVSTIIPVGHESLPERLASEHHALMSSTLQWIAFVAQGCFFPSNIGALGGFR